MLMRTFSVEFRCITSTERPRRTARTGTQPKGYNIILQTKTVAFSSCSCCISYWKKLKWFEKGNKTKTKTTPSKISWLSKILKSEATSIHDVTGLRKPAEDDGDLRRMLSSADRKNQWGLALECFHSGRWQCPCSGWHSRCTRRLVCLTCGMHSVWSCQPQELYFYT